MTSQVKTGDKLGEWTVIEYRPKDSLCSCSCGITINVLVRNSLLLGNLDPDPNVRKSSKCRKCAGVKRRGIAGYLDAKLYEKLARVVANAIIRCTCITFPEYKDYGARGIRVCDEWMNDRKKFVLYLTTLPGYDKHRMVLDRKNNNNNYEPGNLRFVSYTVSNLNKRRAGATVVFSKKKKEAIRREQRLKSGMKVEEAIPPIKG